MRFISGDDTGLVKVVDDAKVSQTIGSQGKGLSVCYLTYSDWDEESFTVAHANGLIEVHTSTDAGASYSTVPARSLNINELGSTPSSSSKD